MLVRTYVNGKATTIRLMVSEKTAAKHTKGSHVQIRGTGRSFLVCEK
jgi:hypothetical protein